ncbi:MAG: hypothetical protein AAB900_02430 [Patescibacteria group bacterium]
MISNRITIIISASLIALAVGAGFLVAVHLPPEIISHWDSLGRPNGHLVKVYGLAFIPSLAVVLLVLYLLLGSESGEVSKTKSSQTEFNLFALSVFGFLVYLYFLILAWNLHPYSFSVIQALIPAFAVLVFALGHLVRTIKLKLGSNGSPAGTWREKLLWLKFCRLTGRILQVLALVLLTGLFYPDQIFIVFSTLLLVAVVALGLYFFFVTKKIGF